MQIDTPSPGAGPLPNTYQSQASQGGTLGTECQTQSMHKLTCETGGISQRRPRALHEPSNTVVKHMCCEEALLLTFPDLGFDSTNELQQMVGTPCQSQANPRPPTSNHCKPPPGPGGAGPERLDDAAAGPTPRRSSPGPATRRGRPTVSSLSTPVTPTALRQPATG